MFLRATTRKKDGKEHRYWSIVENRRLPGGRVSQRHVLYLGEINSSQAQAWRKSIEVFDEDAEQLTRYTEPPKELKLLLERLHLDLPAQPPPKITAAQVEGITPV